MTFQSFANKSIKPLYILSALLMVIVAGRLLFDFHPRIDIRPSNAPVVRAPLLPIPNVGPIARDYWIKEMLRECFSFNTTDMEETVNNCALFYFDINSQGVFPKVISRTSFGRYIQDNPQSGAVVQAVNTKGPFMIYEGSSKGLPIWRYQTEIMTTRFFSGRTATKRWLIDATMTFDTPDSLFFSGFRFTSFYMEERA
ncbi:hypothetical protein [Marinobacter salsuginis]|jgi:hypothetical protein|uniref:Uncharacterized protein n=1 Tax=Marinobacter salsuginis TaxID=418719 RepID=A0A5M3Q0V8_9GAMM|nr:hypothetical protein [Marinobacter salsuginis]GBO88710.1 hypothetical protein MSSD14B_23780 [Marinobacter salsuginis]